MKITVKRYVDQKVIWLIFAVLMVLSVITMYFGTIHRFTYASKYEEYSQVSGRVYSLQEYEHTDSDDDTYYTYSAVIGYTANGTEYLQNTDDIFSEDNVPDEGRRVPILYRNDNPDDYVVAKYDWLSQSLVPLKDGGDIWLFTGVLLLGFALILLATVWKSDSTREVLLGVGLLLIGIDGIVMGAILRNYAMFFLILFGAVGAYVLYLHFFSNSQTGK